MVYLPSFVISPKRLVALAIFAPFVASQIFWLWKFRSWKQHLCRSVRLRAALDAAGAAVYIGLVAFAVMEWKGRHAYNATHLTVRAALFDGPSAWWLFGSIAGFLLYVAVLGIGWAVTVAARAAGHARPAGPGAASGANTVAPETHHAPKFTPRAPVEARRLFLRRAALAAAAAPFVGGAYGIIRERVEFEVTHRLIHLPHLPRAFDGFRILQLSDLHIGPFMTATEVRKVVQISNALKPDLALLTGDYVIWDPQTQFAVVDALSGLRAPHGVWGCLGNHEIYAGIEDSITRLFALSGIRILRQEQAAVFVGRDFINLIGVDFESRFSFGPSYREPGYVREYLEGVDKLILPGTANLLLSHNPNTFDRAAELGIDLTLAGHTHGGQIALELGGENVSPVRLLTAYVEGLFRKGASQLYVNRGIGTIGLPIRLGAPPEITVYRLLRSA